ncbi:MAG: SRPBCC family protein [Planctomycetota bacterium]|jgi:uncharacterized protein YndB with AHSA1/START domain
MGITIGPLHVRRNILINASPARVWREFESFDRLAGWFGHGHALEVYEPEVEGEVRLSVELDGARRRFGGRIVVLDPARELSYESNWDDASMRWPVPTFHTLRLVPMYGGTMVELFHHGFERLGAGAADQLQGYEQGWGVQHLAALRRIVEA